MNYPTSALKLIGMVLVSLLLSACQSTREVLNLETSVEFEFHVAQNVNPDEDNRASPLMLTLVQLRDNRQFESEDFIELYQDPKKRLSGDFISASSFKEFLPGERRDEFVVLTPEVKYIGLIAAYSQYKKAVTKLVLPIDPHSANGFAINIEELGIRLR